MGKMGWFGIIQVVISVIGSRLGDGRMAGMSALNWEELTALELLAEQAVMNLRVLNNARVYMLFHLDNSTPPIVASLRHE